jgi:hypothetical protein
MTIRVLAIIEGGGRDRDKSSKENNVEGRKRDSNHFNALRSTYLANGGGKVLHSAFTSFSRSFEPALGPTTNAAARASIGGLELLV